jgi:hypothetical protein
VRRLLAYGWLALRIARRVIRGRPPAITVVGNRVTTGGPYGIMLLPRDRVAIERLTIISNTVDLRTLRRSA